MSQLNAARSEPVVTGTPSPPASISHGALAGAHDGSAKTPVVREAPTVSEPVPAASVAPASAEAMAQAAKQIESYLKSVGRELNFHLDEASGRMVVSVYDAATGEMIRSIPGEETLRIARSLGSAPNALIDIKV